MPRLPCFAASRRSLRVALLWLLAFVVPLQCSAALARMAAGPMHSHVGAAVAAPVVEPTLRDFRRDIGPAATRAATSAAPALARLLLHGHAHPQRHHHGAGDGAITAAGDSALERIDASEDGGGAAGGAFSALLPLVGVAPAWQADARGDAPPRSLPWAASSRVVASLERPPRGRQD